VTRLSYIVSIYGHKDTASEEESRAFEEDVAAKVREFVATLDGVDSATFNGGVVGTSNLMEAADADTES
jgi:hypothetical protein